VGGYYAIIRRQAVGEKIGKAIPVQAWTGPEVSGSHIS